MLNPTLIPSQLVSLFTHKNSLARQVSNLLKSWVWAGSLGMVLGLGGGAWAAETVTVSVDGLSISLTTQELSSFAETGNLPPNVAALASFLQPDDLAALRSGINSSFSIPQAGIAQLLETPSGQRVLSVFGKFIQTDAGQPGGDALKTAMVQAAGQSQGLTLLGVIEQFPGTTMNIQGSEAIPLINAVFAEIRQTQAVIATINKTSQATQAQAAPLPNNLVDLTAPGRVDWQVKSLTLTNSQAQFQFPVNLYLPNLNGPIPLVIISPGLGEDLNTYAYLAEHLASYGFGVAVVDHPGSDAQRQAEFLAGKIPQEVIPEEFTNRPRSISDTLDYLAKMPGVNLLTNNVGIIGHSFGGYDTWAVAGANPQLDNLTKICQTPQTIIKPSVLLQCNLTKATAPLANLRDSRFQAGMAINPVGGAIYGTAGFSSIEIPLLVLAGSQDFVAPPFLEQFTPFAWLGSPQKYLLLLNGGTHLSTMGDLPPENSPNALPPFVVGEDPGIARNQLQAVSVAFMQTYLNRQSNYQVYLTPGYLAQLSQPQMKGSLVNTLTPAQLQESTSTQP